MNHLQASIYGSRLPSRIVTKTAAPYTLPGVLIQVDLASPLFDSQLSPLYSLKHSRPVAQQQEATANEYNHLIDMRRSFAKAS